MLKSTIRWTALAAIVVGAGSIAFGQTAGQDHWVTTWAASPQQPRVLTPPAPPAGAPAVRPANQPPAPPPPIMNFQNQTVRMIVHTSIGGRRARVELSNAHGAAPLTIGAAHLAIRAKDSAIVPSSDRPLLFAGKASCTIPPGALMVSDPVDLDLAPLSDLAISVYVPGQVSQPTMHATGLHTNYISKGDATGQAAIADAATSQAWYWISAVDVAAPADAAAIVAFGDSITDGARSTPDTNHNWPSFLAERLQAANGGKNIAVANEGISGNRLLADGAGINALARFDRDVLSLRGVKWLVVLEGINDIGIGTRANAQASDAVTADALTGALRQIIERAHAHGIKVIGGTLTPFEGAAYYAEQGEELRQAVNRWIRTSGAFDAVVDFESVEKDSGNPKQFRQDFNDGDHLHPNDAGYKAMADAIDLSIFGVKGSLSASSAR